ncbi:MAG TPA: hypothetical protein VJA17_04740 [Candidatus Omnitrophota bacterium]|nr:hypothetical protein [Candidatus Omnitrophota bacterium]
METKHKLTKITGCIFLLLLSSGCTVKAVGDPNRPITINAHITVDIKGLKDSASNIEDFVSGEKSPQDLKKTQTGGNK